MKNPDYILHAAPESVIDDIQKEGFEYQNGKPTVTGSLPFAVNFALKQGYKEKPSTRDELRKILIMKAPDGKIIAPGYKGTMDIDDIKKEIHGHTTIWSSSRMESGIYDDRDVHKFISPNKLNKLTKEEATKFINSNNLDEKKIVAPAISAIVVPSERLENISKGLRKHIWMLNKIDFEKYYMEIKQEFMSNKENKIADNISINDVVKSLLKTTITQEVGNFIRNVFLMMKESDGYKIFRNNDRRSVLETYKGLFERDGKRTFVEYMELLHSKVNNMLDGHYDFDLTGQENLSNLNRYLRISINQIYDSMKR